MVFRDETTWDNPNITNQELYNNANIALLQNGYSNDPLLADRGTKTINDTEWVLDMLSFYRSVKPQVAGPIDRTPRDITDIRLYRTVIFGAIQSILVEGSMTKCDTTITTTTSRASGLLCNPIFVFTIFCTFILTV